MNSQETRGIPKNSKKNDGISRNSMEQQMFMCYSRFLERIQSPGRRRRRGRAARHRRPLPSRPGACLGTLLELTAPSSHHGAERSQSCRPILNRPIHHADDLHPDLFIAQQVLRDYGARRRRPGQQQIGRVGRTASGPSGRSLRPVHPSVRSVRPARSARPARPSGLSARPVRPVRQSVRSVRPARSISWKSGISRQYRFPGNPELPGNPGFSGNPGFHGNP